MRSVSLVLVLGCVLLSGCQPAGNGEPTGAGEPDEPAVAAESAGAGSSPLELFNGQNLDGWDIVNNGQFSVEDGVIMVDRGTGWLRSAETFGDFVLTMEFRFMEEGANGGIYVRTGAASNDDDNGWPVRGYQVQCRDAIDDGVLLAHLIAVGDVSFEDESDADALRSAYRPTGEWQTYDIRAEGENLSVSLNGVLITTATGIGDLTGHIGIQAELGLLEFRRIDVQEL